MDRPLAVPVIIDRVGTRLGRLWVSGRSVGPFSYGCVWSSMGCCCWEAWLGNVQASDFLCGQPLAVPVNID